MSLPVFLFFELDEDDFAYVLLVDGSWVNPVYVVLAVLVLEDS